MKTIKNQNHLKNILLYWSIPLSIFAFLTLLKYGFSYHLNDIIRDLSVIVIITLLIIPLYNTIEGISISEKEVLINRIILKKKIPISEIILIKMDSKGARNI